MEYNHKILLMKDILDCIEEAMESDSYEVIYTLLYWHKNFKMYSYLIQIYYTFYCLLWMTFYSKQEIYLIIFVNKNKCNNTKSKSFIKAYI